MLIAIQQRINLLFLIAASAAIGFLIMDAQAKTVQRRFINRSEAIEKFFRNLDPSQDLEGQVRAQLSALPTIPESFHGPRKRYIASVARKISRATTYYVCLASSMLVLLI